MMMMDPDPTEVRPTRNPRTKPTMTVGTIRTANGGIASRGSRPAILAFDARSPWIHAFKTIAAEARISVHPKGSS